MRETDIYGDYQDYGYPIDRDAPVERFNREDFNIVWPPGYWEEYEKLRDEARRLARDDRACLVMKMNGKFQVRTTGCVAQQQMHTLVYVCGPEMPDRLEAWAAFIDSISTKPTKALFALAGKALKINMNRVKR